MHSFGPFPFVIEDPGKAIIADVISMENRYIPDIDEYEGPEYKRIWDQHHQAYIYVKADNNPQGFPVVQGGNWLEEG